MNPVLRSYAHTAWTPADPLAGLDPEARRAILLMPSTFRERWKLAPWTTPYQRRLAVADIVAERRLMLELAQSHRMQQAPAPSVAPDHQAGTAVGSPYYAYRLAMRKLALEDIARDRLGQDRTDIDRIPEARADRDVLAQRRALAVIAVERARLELQELDVLEGLPATLEHPTAPARVRTAARKQDHHR